VLAYHAISDTWRDPLCVDHKTFGTQLRALARRGYRGVTFSEAARELESGSRRVVAITFDDAFATVLSARSVLDQLGWPATIFVPTAPVESRSPMRWLIGDRWTPEQDAHLMSLSWSELGELLGAGWEVGSHSRTHRRLSALDDDEATEELVVSRAEIEERVGPCSAISYPWGELDARVIALAREAGYATGSGLAGGRAYDPLAVPRFAIAAGDGALEYALKTSAVVWRARGSRAWQVVDYVRHGRHGDGHLPGSVARTAVVLDGNTGPGLAVTRSLGRAGWTVLAPAGSRAARSRFASGSVSIPDPVQKPDEFAAALRSLVDDRPLDVVVPTTDASLAGAWETLGELRSPRIVGGDAAAVLVGLDKVACLRAAEEHGFPVSAWRAPRTRAEAHEALEELGLPCVVKPRRSFARRGDSLEHRRHRFVESEEQLDTLLSMLGDGDDLPIMQEYVPGRALSVSAVIHRGEAIATIARETFSFYPVAGGTSVWKRTVPPGDVGVAEAVRLLKAIGLEGVAEVEYQVDRDGMPRLMEIGARLHGWVPLAIAAGIDLPLLAARVAVGDPVAPVDSYRVGAEMRWPAGELLRLRSVLRRSAPLPPGMRRRDVLAGTWPPWRPGMRYDGIDPLDPLPSLKAPGALLRRGSR
jgi:peptidoglycan/xylan/chitin deacetylase (PgdA/CDA1 family)